MVVDIKLYLHPRLRIYKQPEGGEETSRING
jgi:hypothetical protein